MEKVLNMNREEVFELINNFNLEPLGNQLIITLNNTEADADNPFEMESMLSETQFVLAIGPMVRQIQLGDNVALNMDKMTISIPDPNNAYSKINKIKIEPVTYGVYTFGLINADIVKYIIK